MDAPQWLAHGKRHVWRPYTQAKTAVDALAVEGTSGVRLQLADGRELIDGIASWWTACHGYNHPHIAERLAYQLAKMPHVMLGGLMHEPAAQLAHRLASLLPGSLDRVFFSDSGSVAVEVAMKIALQHAWHLGQRQRTRFVSFRDGYHGDTFACMSVTDPDEGMHSLFRPVLMHQLLAELPINSDSALRFEQLLQTHRDEIAGVILEPLAQCAGGMKFHSAETLAMVAQLCAKYEILLILDEVATGFGRTGTMFACEQADVVPDLICLSKALTGGTLPLAATVAKEEVYASFYSDSPTDALMHGPTFMGNALGCAAAHASLDLFATRSVLPEVSRISAQMAEELAPCLRFAGVVDVRVLGAIGAVELTDGQRDLEWLRARFIEHGVWIRPLGNVVYLMPALNIAEMDLSALTSAICHVTRAWSTQR